MKAMSGKQRAGNKELRVLLRAIELEGGRVILARSNHWKIYKANGRGWYLITTVASTPSDCHARQNAIRQLRRHGFELEGFH
jgi:hypothetical protein